MSIAIITIRLTHENETIEHSLEVQENDFLLGVLADENRPELPIIARAASRIVRGYPAAQVVIDGGVCQDVHGLGPYWDVHDYDDGAEESEEWRD